MDRPNLRHPDMIDMIPVPILLVDGDINILDLNHAATRFFGLVEDANPFRRCGDVFRCKHSSEAPEGCGHGAECDKCVIRNSVTTCLEGMSTTRKRMKLNIKIDGKETAFDLLITANVSPENSQVALVVIEDISELSKLRSIIPNPNLLSLQTRPHRDGILGAGRKLLLRIRLGLFTRDMPAMPQQALRGIIH